MKNPLPKVRFDTCLGSYTVELHTDVAPASARDVLSYVDCRLLEGASIYRIVTRENSPTSPSCFVQFGVWPIEPMQRPLPMIAHEPTGITGLRHSRGTLSHGRFGPGTAGGAWLICMKDMPHFDEGSSAGDGLGYAACGRVVEGMDVLDRILSLAEPTDILEKPIAIIAAQRLANA